MYCARIGERLLLAEIGTLVGQGMGLGLLRKLAKTPFEQSFVVAADRDFEWQNVSLSNLPVFPESTRKSAEYWLQPGTT